MNGASAYRVRILLGLALFAGCGQSECFAQSAPKTAKAANGRARVGRAVVDEGQSNNRRRPGDRPSSADVRPDQPINATLVVDLRKLPRMKGAEVQLNGKSGVAYSVAAPFDQVIEFSIATLTDAGWHQKKSGRIVEEFSTQFEFTKDGCCLWLFVVFHPTKDGFINVAMINQGNADTRDLPRQDDATMLEASYASTGFVTAAKRAEVVAFCRKELPALGWQPYSERDTDHEDFAFEVLNFKKNGTGLRVYIGEHPDHPGKTAVFYSAGVPRDDLPVPRGAKQVVFGALYLSCEISSKPTEILQFYRGELASLGWTEMRRGEQNGACDAPIAFDRADGKKLTLQLTEADDGVTLVTLKEPGEHRRAIP
jgi:hypothetical protein